jgi:RadC-like JAB domain
VERGRLDRVKFYHGTVYCFPIGTVLRPLREPREIEQDLEKARPSNEVSRLKAVYATTLDKVRTSGVDALYVYEIVPEGRVSGPFDGGWYARAGRLKSAEKYARATHTRRAYRAEYKAALEAYWSKKRCSDAASVLPNKSCYGDQEWLLEGGARIVALVQVNDGSKRISPDASKCAGRYRKDLPTEIVAETPAGATMTSMAKELQPVAMEPDHSACEACETCGGISAYVEQVTSALRDLGDPSPEDTVARSTKLVRGARKSGMSPANAAGLLLAMSGRDPTSYTPRYRLEETCVEEYSAYTADGKRVIAGPYKYYEEARLQAQKQGGIVKWADGASEPAINGGASEAPTYRQTSLPPGHEKWERGFDYFPEWKLKRQHQSYAGQQWEEDWQVARGSSKWTWGVKQNDATSWSVFAIDRHGHQYHVAFAGNEADAKHAAAIADARSSPGAAEPGAPQAQDDKFESCVQHVKTESSDANPWAVCHATLGREPEPYTRKNLNWHRDANGNYYNDDTDYGKISVRSRDQDKRAGVLRWYAVVKKIEVAQGETRAEVNEAVEKHLRAPRETAAAEVAIVERSPDAAPGGTRLASPKDVHALLGKRYGRLGQEVIEVLIVNLNDQLVGQPVQVAMGQVSGVRVEVEQIMAVFIAGRAQGGTGAWLCHNHPAGTLSASAADKDLTKQVEAARKIAAPNMRFMGHLIVTEKGTAKA